MARAGSPITLSIDIGGTGIKAMLLDRRGRSISERQREKTPRPATPRRVVDVIEILAQRLTGFDRVSVGFPGVLIEGVVRTAANLHPAWIGQHPAELLRKSLKKPVRIANDADMQGLAVIAGDGLELVLTLGTGLGTAVFQDGVPMPHLELALMPFHGKGTFQDHLGNQTRRRIGNRKWSDRVLEAVEMFDALLHFDRLYVGGGNAKKLKVDLGHRATIVDNTAGIHGGIRLWDIAEI